MLDRDKLRGNALDRITELEKRIEDLRDLSRPTEVIIYENPDWQQIAGWISTGTVLRSINGEIILDPNVPCIQIGAGGFIESEDFAAGVSGFQINGGVAEFNDVTIRGTIYAVLGEIGGWIIGATSLMDAAGEVGMSSAVTGGDDVRFWAGGVVPATAPFSVTEAGVLAATAGTVGRWEMTALSLGGMDPGATAYEIVTLAFQWVGWAQFAIFDTFDDETKRESPDPSAFDASNAGGILTNGGDDTADRVFGWYSKVYTDMTTVTSGTSDDVGLNYLEDADGDWFEDQYIGFVLVDSATTEFAITGCTETPRRIVIAGTPAAGAYTIKADDPAYCAGFASFSDSTQGGGDGFTKLEVTFDDGANWLTLLDTSVPTNYLGGGVAIVNTGTTYQFRVSLTNDGAGAGAVMHNVIVCTDPSPWG